MKFILRQTSTKLSQTQSKRALQVPVHFRFVLAPKVDNQSSTANAGEDVTVLNNAFGAVHTQNTLYIVQHYIRLYEIVAID